MIELMDQSTNNDRTVVRPPALAGAAPVRFETATQRHADKPKEVNDSWEKLKVRVETRPGAHRYWIRRPQALQYFRDGTYVQNARPGDAEEAESGPEQLWTERARHRVATNLIPLPEQPKGTYVPVVRRRQLDIFLDLLWVGIIGNISDQFSETAFETRDDYGHSFLEFLVLFMLAWQIWNYLRRFLNEYYLDDIAQRAFVVWILILALAYGNNAPFLLDGYSNLVIGIFLVAKGSFILLEALYSNIFIPGLRRLFFIGFLLTTPSLALFIGCIFTPWPKKAALLIPALLWEAMVQTIIASPIGDRLLQNHMKKAPDPEHYVERLENFFIIILGYGIFALIQNSPLGAGISRQVGVGVLVLMLYFFLFCAYFAGDGSRNYIHAVRRAWWGAELWLSLHLIMYASILLLEVALITLIGKDGAPVTTPTSTIEARFIPIPEEDRYAVQSAKWTAAVTFDIALLCMTLMALLKRSLDRPGTLIINNRYIRLAPRAALMVVVLCLPIQRTQPVFVFVAIIMWLLFAVMIFEWGTSLEKGGGFFEPKTAED